MRVGIFGGTFNPVHLGHLRSADEVRAKFNLQRVYFIPCNKPPHKSSRGMAPAGARLRMLRLALKENRNFICSDMEIRRGGKSYSIDTARHFLESGIKKEELFFIMGEDSFAEIRSWKDYGAFLTICNLIVTSRPGFKRLNLKKILTLDLKKDLRYNKNRKCYETGRGTFIYPVEITGLDISSSDIRKILREGGTIRYLVPESVERYIRFNGLYHC